MKHTWYPAALRRGRAITIIVLVSLLLTSLPAVQPSVAATPATPPVEPSAPLAPMACDPDRAQASGAVYRICMPFFWNRDLIVYAHGYVSALTPVGIPEDQLRLSDGTYVPDVANLLGYAFATTSYSANGLAVKQGLADLADLVSIFRAKHPTLRRVYLAGVSEGGLITTLAIEQFPNVFDGGVAACGLIGDFRGQVNYVGDFRVVFDYFFPGLIPGSPVDVPPALMNNWPAFYATTVLPVITAPANAISVTQVLSATGAAYVPAQPETISRTFASALWYSILATNDAKAKLGGQPFGNQGRVYQGTFDDAALNTGVQRFTADAAALAEIERSYQTAGRPLVPLVTLHTTLDETVPYWHETLYRAKVVANRRSPRHDNIPVAAYGHCNFSQNDVMQALTLLQTRVNNPPRWQTDLPLVLK